MTHAHIPGMTSRRSQLVQFLTILFIILAVFMLVTCANAAALSISFQDNASNEDGFIVERRESTSNVWVKVVTLPPCTEPAPMRVTYIDRELKEEVVYWYRVKAFNTSGSSLPSNSVGMKTGKDLPPVTPAAAPSNSTVEPAPPGA